MEEKDIEIWGRQQIWGQQQHKGSSTRRQHKTASEYLCVERLLDGLASLNLRFSTLDGSQNLLVVLQLRVTLPEDLPILPHLDATLAFHFAADRVDVFTSILLHRLQELVEVPFRPVPEALQEMCIHILKF